MKNRRSNRVVVVLTALALVSFVVPQVAVADTEDVDRWPLMFLPALILIALARNDAPPLSVQPAHILGEAAAAVAFTANF